MNNLNQNKYLVNCHSCGKEIHKSSKICPYCGAKKPWYKKPGNCVAIGILIFFIIGVIVSIGDTESNTQSTTSNTIAQKVEENNTISNEPIKEENTIEYIPFNLIQGMRELKENELKFKENYDEKYVETSGEISTFSEAGEKIYVSLNLGDEFWLDSAYFYFKSSEKDKLLNLKKGDTVKVRGRLVLTTVFKSIEVRDCEIVG